MDGSAAWKKLDVCQMPRSAYLESKVIEYFFGWIKTDCKNCTFCWVNVKEITIPYFQSKRINENYLNTMTLFEVIFHIIFYSQSKENSTKTHDTVVFVMF